MLKYTSSVLAATFLAFLLGCGDDETTENGTTTSPPSGSSTAATALEGKDIWTAAGEGNIEVVKANLTLGIDINAMVPAGSPVTGATPLHVAAISNQVEVVKFLISKGADVNIKAGNKDGATPLTWAVVFGKYESVIALIESGKADINSLDNNGATALDALPFDPTFGADPTISVDKPKIKAYLMAKGAKPGTGVSLNQNSPAASPEGKSIWDAAGEGDIELLQVNLTLGTDINAMVPVGFPFAGGTPLHIAAISDQVEVIAFLLDKGADVNIKAGDENGSTPLHWAAVFGKYEAVKALIETGKADVNALDNNRATALDALPFDLSFGADPTISVDKPKIKAYLLAQGARPGAGVGSDPGSPTPSAGAKDIWTAAAEGNIAAIQALLDAGIDINSRVPAGFDFEGATALHIAVLTKQGKVAQFLGDKGADVNAKTEDKDGSTPLHLAAAFGNIDFVQGLILYKADVNSRDNSGLTPLDALASDPTGGLLAKNPAMIANKEKIKALLVGEGAKTKAELDK